MGDLAVNSPGRGDVINSLLYGNINYDRQMERSAIGQKKVACRRIFVSLLLSIFLGMIGMGYLGYGKKVQRYSMVLAGLLMMVFPYAVENIILMLLIGGLLCSGPFILDRFNMDF